MMTDDKTTERAEPQYVCAECGLPRTKHGDGERRCSRRNCACWRYDVGEAEIDARIAAAVERAMTQHGIHSAFAAAEMLAQQPDVFEVVALVDRADTYRRDGVWYFETANGKSAGDTVADALRARYAAEHPRDVPDAVAYEHKLDIYRNGYAAAKEQIHNLKAEIEELRASAPRIPDAPTFAVVDAAHTAYWEARGRDGTNAPGHWYAALRAALRVMREEAGK